MSKMLFAALLIILIVKFLCNYFDNPTKLFLDLYLSKFLDISAKCSFHTIARIHKNLFHFHPNAFFIFSVSSFFFIRLVCNLQILFAQKNNVSWRHIEQFACVANEQTLSCINPNLSIPKTSSDGVTQRYSFMLDPIFVCPSESFRMAAAYGLQA